MEDSDVIADEIADDLQAALKQFAAIATELQEACRGIAMKVSRRRACRILTFGEHCPRTQRPRHSYVSVLLV